MNRNTSFSWSLIVLASVFFAGCTQGQGVRRANDFSAHFDRAAVAADHPMASDAGARMLAKGGNAVDAAVAASFTLSVVRPYSCGIGGGGFMVIHLPDDPTHGFVSTAINYRETSPYDAGYYERTGASATTGGAAVAIPGTVAGLVHALEHYGTLDLETVLQPAIDACIQGFVVDDHYAQNARGLIERFESHPEMKHRFPLVWNQYLGAGGIKRGDRIRNIGMHKAFNWIQGFGQGAYAEHRMGGAVVDAIERAGGSMSIDDLLGYTPTEVAPIVREIDGRTFLCMPPPSSGGVTMIECLEILDASGYDFDRPVFVGSDTDRVGVLVESMKHAFADRSRYLADSAFVDVPVEELLDQENIERMASMIDGGDHPPAYYGTSDLLPTDGGTSHVSVVDHWGGAVAMTETINLGFGSLVGVDEFGFVLNNEMDDFTTVRGQPNAFGLVQSDRNMPALGKRPLSSMSPTIVLDADGRVFAVAGASGGPRIITSTMQALLSTLGGMDAGAAVDAPRVHHQWMPDVLRYEDRAHHQIRARLVGRFEGEMEPVDAIGNVQLIRRGPDEKGWQAASDPRKGGRPAGLD